MVRTMYLTILRIYRKIFHFFISSGRQFQICVPILLILLSLYVTVFWFDISKLHFGLTLLSFSLILLFFQKGFS